MVELAFQVQRQWEEAREIELLLDAAAGGDLDQFRERLERLGPSLQQDPVAWHEVIGTALHEAAICWSAEIAELLLELGADLDAPGPFGRPLLYGAANKLPGRDGIPEASGAALIALLIRHGADVNLAFGPKRATPLHMAARRGNTQIARVLLEAGAHIEARDSNGETPLRRAVNCGQPEVAALLLAHGADRTSRCRRGLTPLDAARTEQIRRLFTTECAEDTEERQGDEGISG